MVSFPRADRSLAIRMEALDVPTKPYHLMTFKDPSSVEECKVMSDADVGGYTKTSLSFESGTATDPPHARFSGNISVDLPPNRPEIQRSGYSAWRTRDRPRTLFGRSLFDVDPYAFLALRVKSDGRKYFINIQTESIVPTDIHQHRLYAQKPGEWETVVVSFHEFVRTNYGMPVEPQMEIMKQKVRSVGIGLIDRVPGPFDLCISEIFATNDSGGRMARGAKRSEEKLEIFGEMGREKTGKDEPEKILI